MFFDGKLIIENSTSWEAGELFFMMGSTEKRTVLKNLSKGQEYSIEIRGQFRVNVGPVPVPFGIRIGAGLIVDEQQRVHEAAALAASSDLAIVMVGLNGEFESEGMDRKDME
jgi:beta-glucosidase